MIKLMKEISNKKSIEDSFISSFGVSLDDLEIQWKKDLGIIDRKNETSTSSELNNGALGSCNGGSMGFELSSIILLLFAYFVKKKVNN